GVSRAPSARSYLSAIPPMGPHRGARLIRVLLPGRRHAFAGLPPRPWRGLFGVNPPGWSVCIEHAKTRGPAPSLWSELPIDEFADARHLRDGEHRHECSHNRPKKSRLPLQPARNIRGFRERSPSLSLRGGAERRLESGQNLLRVRQQPNGGP